MDKISSSPQAMPLWERQKSNRGHKSSVDKALQAHRQRKAEREGRVQDRLNIVRGMQARFFPHAYNVMNRPDLAMSEVQNMPMQAQTQIPQLQTNTMEPEVVEAPQFQPMEMDALYQDAQLTRTGDNAVNIISNEINAPQDGPMEDVPKGSYVDYTV